jgi:hypothetical protein
MARAEASDDYQSLLDRPLTSPWEHLAGTPRYRPDLSLLQDLVAIPIRAGQAQNTGRFAKAIDAWCAHELRRAGFDPDEVWPRASRPRVLPREVALLLKSLPRNLRQPVLDQVLRNPAVAPAEARVLGRVFLKQADVLIAQWSRGAELLISTKSQLSSYAKNLRNRFEESYGDAKNLRGRFPLLSLGFLYFLRSTVSEEPSSWELALDMLRKLREEPDVYDATALVVGEWDDANFQGVMIDQTLVPEDLRADRLMETLIGRILERTPVHFHVHVRELRDQRELPLEEGAQPVPEDEEDG